MKKWICKTLLRLSGWKIGSTEGVDLPKCVICVAPHTSNWDFILGKLFYTAIGCQAGFLMKKEWFFFPLGCLFRSMGGVPVDRKKKSSTTEQVVDMFRKNDRFQIAITPEGTRKRRAEWKKGFYYIALQAKVPIMIAYFDYAKKVVGSKGIFHPTGDYEKDIRYIREQFRGVTACHPENFVHI
ncbi:MAG: lysophospholipid acyltransferase family protein [Parabacteroides sp.]